MQTGGTEYIEGWHFEAAWAATKGKPGASFWYARGPALDPGNAVVKLAAQLQREGKAELHIQRNGVPVYVIKRPGAKVAPAPAAPGERRLRLDPEFEESGQGRMLRLLSRCANFGLPCPSYQELADQLALRDRFEARRLFDKLRESGRIETRTPDQGQTRVVTIVATGKRTAWTGTSVPAAEIEVEPAQAAGRR